MPSKQKTTKTESTLLSLLDFGFEVFKEKIPNNGEDSYLYTLEPFGAIVGVFDGCGGSGAKRYEKYQGKTGAYMASRVVSGATRDWFFELENENDSHTTEALKDKIKQYLSICRSIGGGTTAFKGSMSKDFPTTAAVILMGIENKSVNATCFWAGDSRCYLLDSEGLKQLTEDDLGGLDAMENLTADGVLTNVISSSKDFSLHQKTIPITKPSLIFAATDGCFGYFSTPMEFEHLLLSTLFSAENVEEWEQSISDVLKEVAGDDYSMSGVSLGYGSLSNLKKSLEKRYSYLYTNYIADLDKKDHEEKVELWRSYKSTYTQFIK